MKDEDGSVVLLIEYALFLRLGSNVFVPPPPELGMFSY